MIHEKIYLSDTSKAYLETYLLSPSDQIQIGWKHPAVIVCPGGAYLRTSDQEAEQVALHSTRRVITRQFCAIPARKQRACQIRCWSWLWGYICCVAAQKAGILHRTKLSYAAFLPGGICGAMLSTQYAQAAKLLGLAAADVRPDAAILGYPCTDMNYPPKLVSIDNFVIGKVDPACPESLSSRFTSARCAKKGKHGCWILCGHEKLFVRSPTAPKGGSRPI